MLVCMYNTPYFFFSVQDGVVRKDNFLYFLVFCLENSSSIAISVYNNRRDGAIIWFQSKMLLNAYGVVFAKIENLATIGVFIAELRVKTRHRHFNCALDFFSTFFLIIRTNIHIYI